MDPDQKGTYQQFPNLESDRDKLQEKCDALALIPNTCQCFETKRKEIKWK